MSGKAVISALIIGIAAMMIFSIVPAMAGTGQGEITSINKPGTHGKLVRTDDGSNSEYQFQIPQGLADQNYIPSVGDCITFDINPDPAKKATNVAQCGGGGGDTGGAA